MMQIVALKQLKDCDTADQEFRNACNIFRSDIGSSMGRNIGNDEKNVGLTGC